MMADILVLDHAEVDALFGDLSAAFARGGAREVFEKLDYLWARLAVHIRAEHLHLFPDLLAAAEGRGVGTGDTPTREQVCAAVERLREDHDFFMRELAAAVNASRELASRAGSPDREQLLKIRGRVRAVAERLVEHNRVEKEQVYGWSEALLHGERGDTLGPRLARPGIGSGVAQHRQRQRLLYRDARRAVCASLARGTAARADTRCLTPRGRGRAV
jgi:hypothetical protein